MGNGILLCYDNVYRLQTQIIFSGVAETPDFFYNDFRKEVLYMSRIELIRELKEIPASYRQEAEKQGKLEKVEYTTADYENPEKLQHKYALVYVPYGYDPAEKYDLVCLIHGGDGTPESYYDGDGKPTDLKNILDHMIADGLMKPVLVLTPTFCPEDRTELKKMEFPVKIGYLDRYTAQFWKELTQEILPAVEGTYSTWAEGTDAGSLIKARDHRLVSGFSMGSVTTWNILTHAAAYFRYYVPMSGDYWGIERAGGSSKTEETVKLMRDEIAGQGMKPEDYFIYAMTGSEDIAYPNLSPMIEGMYSLHDPMFTPVEENGNLAWFVKKDGYHRYSDITEYVFNLLPRITF